MIAEEAEEVAVQATPIVAATAVVAAAEKAAEEGWYAEEERFDNDVIALAEAADRYCRGMKAIAATAERAAQERLNRENYRQS